MPLLRPSVERHGGGDSDMNYELAKQLKDVGFKYQHDADFCVQNGCFFNEDYIENPNIIHLPHLSELIEACEEELDEINIYITDGLVEVGGANPLYGHDIKVVGTTTEEAVAKLWLALNDK